MSYSFQAIGVVHSCFKEKFGTPRQPGLIKEARGQIEILSPYDCDEAFIGLESFSHIWVLFIFHQHLEQGWKARVRPPRLGGNQRIGVFASRSTYRPNPIGMSVLKLDGIERVKRKNQQDTLLLSVSGLDLVEGTPVIDIKPYIPYSDAIADANGAYAASAPAAVQAIEFSDQAQKQCQAYEKNYPQLRPLIENILALDPRPAYKADKSAPQEFAMRILDFDLRWRQLENSVRVLALEKVNHTESL